MHVGSSAYGQCCSEGRGLKHYISAPVALAMRCQYRGLSYSHRQVEVKVTNAQISDALFYRWPHKFRSHLPHAELARDK